MAADVEMLPLPPLNIAPSVEPVDYPNVAQALMDYARANAAHHTAKLQAEIEALKSDLGDYMDAANYQATRAERLAEALRDALECGEDGDWQSARNYINEALRDHDQEVGNG